MAEGQLIASSSFGRMASRKFLLAVGFEIVLCFFVVFKVIPQEMFADLSKFGLGGYLGANVLHYAVEEGVLVIRDKTGGGYCQSCGHGCFGIGRYGFRCLAFYCWPGRYMGCLSGS